VGIDGDNTTDIWVIPLLACKQTQTDPITKPPWRSSPGALGSYGYRLSQKQRSQLTAQTVTHTDCTCSGITGQCQSDASQPNSNTSLLSHGHSPNKSAYILQTLRKTPNFSRHSFSTDGLCAYGINFRSHHTADQQCKTEQLIV